jgi:dTDP-4-amino-4,6-dideoxygalactose transaminase
VHQVGIPADIDTFEAIARQYGLILLEDNACGLGSVYKGKPLGSSGFCSTLSFHPRKVITTGEGGMLLTSNTNLAEQARVLRAHGMSISDFARHNASSTTYESYHVVGYNYRLTDIQAAIGIKQLEQLEQFVQRRLAIAMAYNTAFADMPELTLIQPAEYVTRWNVQSYPVRLNKATQANRDRLMEALQQVGIATRRGIPPIHQQPVYQTALVLPQTERVSQTSFFLPVYPLMQNQDVQHVIQQVKQVVSRYL